VTRRTGVAVLLQPVQTPAGLAAARSERAHHTAVGRSKACCSVSGRSPGTVLEQLPLLLVLLQSSVRGRVLARAAVALSACSAAAPVWVVRVYDAMQ
jgi:hypothetical protein